MSDDKKKLWNRDEVFLLIAGWEAFPELWDTKSRSFRNRIKKQNALKELATSFNTTVDEVTRKMHNLRTQFHAEIRKIKTKNSSDDDGYRSSWDFFAPMHFILNDRTNVTNPSPTENMNNENSLQYDDSQHYEDSQQYEDTPEINFIKTEHIEPMPENQTETPQIPRPKKRTKHDEPSHNRYSKKAAYVMYKPADKYQIFGDYVASELRSLKNAENKRRLKLNIQRAILRAFEIDAIGSSPVRSDSSVSRSDSPNTSPAASNTSEYVPLF